MTPPTYSRDSRIIYWPAAFTEYLTLWDTSNSYAFVTGVFLIPCGSFWYNIRHRNHDGKCFRTKQYYNGWLQEVLVILSSRFESKLVRRHRGREMYGHIAVSSKWIALAKTNLNKFKALWGAKLDSHSHNALKKWAVFKIPGSVRKRFLTFVLSPLGDACYAGYTK